MSRHYHRAGRPVAIPRAFMLCECDQVLLEAPGARLTPCRQCGAEPVVIQARSDSDALQQRERILNAGQVAA